MLRKSIAVAALLALAGCAAPRAQTPPPAAPIEVQILAINDFHGNLEPPQSPLRAVAPGGGASELRAGGAAQLAAALERAREGESNTITVAAGDLIGASPLTSAYFLDEPTIDAMNLIGLGLAAVGNHEFDKGSGELLRMQTGGCAKHTTRTPCRLEPFGGARFQYLAANVLKGDARTLFPATAIRQFGPIRVGFIGMTLKETGTIVTPSGVAGLRFADEAVTANALVPGLKAAGADAIVLLIHQGGDVPQLYHLQDCDGLSGDILPILDRLDPQIATVVSGHTHQAYACEIERGGAPRLLTSAGKYGYLFTDIRLTFDPATRRLLGRRAANVPVPAAAPSDPRVAALVARYSKAAEPVAKRVVGRLPGPVGAAPDSNRERLLGDLIADSQLAWARAPERGGAQIAFMNGFGVRADLIPRPDGSVTYGQIFAMMPFGNGIVVKSFTGTQLKALLEQQFASGANSAEQPNLLLPSAGFEFDYDLSRETGRRVVAIRFGGRPVDPRARYRVAVNSFLSSGGDNFTVLREGSDAVDAGGDLDALEAYLATNPAMPAGGRIRDLTPKPAT